MTIFKNEGKKNMSKCFLTIFYLPVRRLVTIKKARGLLGVYVIAENITSNIRMCFVAI